MRILAILSPVLGIPGWILFTGGYEWLLLAEPAPEMREEFWLVIGLTGGAGGVVAWTFSALFASGAALSGQNGKSADGLPWRILFHGIPGV